MISRSPGKASDEAGVPTSVGLVLEADNLTYRYDALEALRGISIGVKAGEAVGVVGVNGAGKSTLVKVLAGFFPARSGCHRLFGHEMRGISPRQHMRRGVVLVPEGRQIVTRLSVGDNLLLGASCFGARQPASEAIDFAYATFPELTAHRSRRAGSLSGGQQQMVAIARALVARPRILLLDEPSQGLAPFLQERLAQSFVALLDAGITLLVVEQNLSFARQCTNRLYSIVNGTVGFAGTWDEFVTQGGLMGHQPLPVSSA